MHVVEPLLCSLLEVGWCLVVGHQLIEQHDDAFTHLLVAQSHTHAELAEVLEQ